MMINFRTLDSSSRAQPQSVRRANEQTAMGEMRQDRQGPLDGELLDLYVAMLIAVPSACLLRFLWS